MNRCAILLFASIISRGSVTAARRAHNPQAGGSTPPPATKNHSLLLGFLAAPIAAMIIYRVVSENIGEWFLSRTGVPLSGTTSSGRQTLWLGRKVFYEPAKFLGLCALQSERSSILHRHDKQSYSKNQPTRARRNVVNPPPTTTHAVILRRSPIYDRRPTSREIFQDY